MWSKMSMSLTRTGYSRISWASSRLPAFRYAFHRSRSTSVVRCRPAMKSSEMRAGPWVSRLMLIQNASDSIRPPLRPSMRTRISHQRLDVPEHQRRSRSMSWNSMGLIRSIIVRRTIHSGWVSSNPSSRSWSEPTSWMWRVAASNRNRPARSVSATRSGHCMSNTSGCGSGTGIKVFANPVAAGTHGI